MLLLFIAALVYLSMSFILQLLTLKTFEQSLYDARVLNDIWCLLLYRNHDIFGEMKTLKCPILHGCGDCDMER